MYLLLLLVTSGVHWNIIQKMTTATIENVESYVRDVVKDRKCRITEGFQDFDRLRSGIVTGNFRRINYDLTLIILFKASQFFRVLRNLLGLALTKEFEIQIREKYSVNKGRDIKWKAFVEEIEGVYDNNNFSSSPQEKLLNTIE